MQCMEMEQTQPKKYTAHPHDFSGCEQEQDVQHKHRSISELDFFEDLYDQCCLGGHVGICGLLPQALLKPKVHEDVCRCPQSGLTLEAMWISKVLATARS